MSTSHVALPTKAERHKLFGSVPPIKGTKPTEKEQMVDLQNTPKNFLFALDSVGISNVKHPVNIETPDGIQSTVATFELTTSLVQDRKGINMSRLTEQLDAYHQQGWTVSNRSLIEFAQELAERMEQTEGQLTIRYPWFFTRKAPATGLSGLMNADVMHRVTYNLETGVANVTVGLVINVTTLCPCSKEISEYSAHNQRGYITIEAGLDETSMDGFDWRAALLDVAESNASAPLPPVLKRPDEKRATEIAYENPRFVEDMVRLIAADLYEMKQVVNFFVECRNEESIHQHDAIASITFDKRQDA